MAHQIAKVCNAFNRVPLFGQGFGQLRAEAAFEPEVVYRRPQLRPYSQRGAATASCGLRPKSTIRVTIAAWV